MAIGDEFNNEDFAELVQTGMDKKKLSIKDLAEKMSMSYESARRISNGRPVKGATLKLLANVLSTDIKVLERTVKLADLKRDYGDLPFEIAGKNPELAPIERAWPHLTPSQKKDAVLLIQGWAKGNKS